MYYHPWPTTGNDEANASDISGNIDEMFPRYYTHSNAFNMFIYSTIL